MNEPPRKRRKTSSPPQAPSSPLRKPPRRPSFASPTKASLARNYPSLLPTRTPPRDNFRTQTTQTRVSSPVRADTSPDHTEEGAEEGLPSAESPRGLKAQEGPRRGALFSSPSKRPLRAIQSPLKDASAVQQDQLNRPEDEVMNVDGHNGKEKKARLDPEIEIRKQEKERLQRQVGELEAQVSKCAQEIAAERERIPDDPILPAHQAGLNKFIAKISGADAQDEQPMPISSLLCSFLPFSSTIITASENTRTEKPIASHRPTELKDPLPYLEMFTSFNCSTQLGLPHGKVLPFSRRIHQRHTITMSGPQELLTAQVAIDIDCMTNNVVGMHILRLPSWAERELGTFMRAKAHEKDLGNACWAVDSFWDIATKRAQYWHKCEKAFARLLPRRTAVDTEDIVPPALKSSTLARKDLNRHLGRDVLILQDKHVLLKINWRIVFDWTGEAESNVDLECAVPAVWKEADANGGFHKVPETFDSLLQTRGVFEATRIMVALLFPQ